MTTELGRDPEDPAMTAKILRGRFFGRTLERRELADLVLIESRHAAGSRLSRHAHEHAYFCVNLEGSYSEDYGRRRRRCRAGMLVFHPAGESHAETHDSDVASLNVEIGASWSGRIAEVAAPLDRPAEFSDDYVAGLGARILHELRRDDVDSAVAIEALTWEILAAAADRHGTTVDKRAPRWLRDAREILDTQLGGTTSLRALAAAAGVHPVHFAATFRRFFGCSVGEYLRRRRFDRARSRLAEREVPLAEIAVAAGFADQSHFSRTFKRLTGMTPMQYRALLAFKTRR
jgi:AraC family transcriptional regulator